MGRRQAFGGGPESHDVRGRQLEEHISTNCITDENVMTSRTISSDIYDDFAPQTNRNVCEHYFHTTMKDPQQFDRGTQNLEQKSMCIDLEGENEPNGGNEMSQATVAQNEDFQKKLPGVATPAKAGFDRVFPANQLKNTLFDSVFRELKTVGFGPKTSALSN